jgi:hypothetical protein
MFANSLDIAMYVERYQSHPVLGRAARMLAAVAHDADCHSDGWHSWPLPSRACKQLHEMLRGNIPATEENYRKALAPIKAFYTRAHRGQYGGSYPAMPVLAGE